MSEPLDTKYNPGAIETPLYKEWEEKGYFHASANAVLAGEPAYTIVIPPPNVTAVLHMGHGLNNTLQDVLTRWRRMQGYQALYLPGTDHAGIATQNVVERIIAKDNKTRDDLGREAFVKRVWDFVGETGSTILEQLRAIGCSCDWQRTAFTLDEARSRAVREVFVRLYDKGLIYRGNYIINWCPRCLTALSDEEAEPTETNGKLYHIRYPLAHGKTLPDGRTHITIATTRPETMLGDTAVAVHPDDDRYKGLVGADIELPLTHRLIPIIADEYADPEFGSGAVKMTPAHDPNDFMVMKRHDFPALNIMTPDAHMNENVPEQFRGLERFAARKAVVKALEAAGLIEKVEDHKLAVPHCYRCDTVVEPRLSEQWFVKMKPIADPALQASRDGRVRFTPDRWTKVYEYWLENIRDWCISRQLWWGHRIPVWYCDRHDHPEQIVSIENPDKCPTCGNTELHQDPDVLDTWFSSWLWPFSTLGWPDETEDLKAFYPTSTLVTGPDILFFWVARMIMAGLEFRGEVPFTDVYLNGIVRDAKGRKMSKSLGNGIDPLHVVELYGADALRYTVIAGSGLGTDVLLNHEDLEEAFSPGRNFANKVWNAGRFALMNVGDAAAVLPVAQVEKDLELADRWILSRLSVAVTDTTRALESFRFHEAAETVYHFFWSELADWYLELVKPRFYQGATEASKAAAQSTLVEVLDTVLRLMHPLMPFISDALWRRLPETTGAEREESLVVARWPDAQVDRINADAESQMNALMELIGSVRNLRSEYNVPPATQINIQIANASPALTAALQAETRAVQRLARIGEIGRDGVSEGKQGAHAVLRMGGEVFVALADLIDVGKERERLGKELERVSGMLNATEAKLTNEQFVGKAPANIIEREREKAASLREQTKALKEKLEALA